MSTITVPRAQVTNGEVVEALRNGLGPGYHVRPRMRMTRVSFREPQPDGPDTILVGTGSDRVWRAQVRVIRRSGQTQIRISPGGVAGPLLVNTLGIARKVRHVLSTALG